MLYYSVGQQYAFGYMVICGMIMGAIYKAFRTVRILTVAGRAFTAVLDALMCLLLAGVMAAMLLRANGGELRLYAILACALGMVCFINGPGRIADWLCARLLCLLHNCAKYMENISFFQHFLK